MQAGLNLYVKKKMCIKEWPPISPGEGWGILPDRASYPTLPYNHACIQEEGHNMFIFKSSLAECQGRWRDILWRVHKSFIRVFVIFIALSEHSCTLLLIPWLCVSPNGACAALHVYFFFCNRTRQEKPLR